MFETVGIVKFSIERKIYKLNIKEKTQNFHLKKEAKKY